MSFIPPISKGEFWHLLQKTIPPNGWPKTLAVANSGGPDSTCLLYLLSTIIGHGTHQGGLPQELKSIHVNHDLQELSTTMADHANKTAEKLGVESLVVTIPWAAPNQKTIFPPRPTPDKPFEDKARDARLNQLFHGMTTLGAKAIAFGHHADDQVETSVMRLASGSGEVGAMGMRPVRRWGMGGETRVAWTGAPGMERFIVRPLLEVSKDRILATCEANGLEYVTDPTNFQPEATLRNYIRSAIDGLAKDPPEIVPWTENSHPLADESYKILGAIRHLNAPLQSPADPVKKENLREEVRKIGQNVEKIETQVTNFLHQNLLPSPPASMLITQEAFHTIRDPAVRVALVRRILRFASPRAWGSPKAETYGKASSYEKILAYIYGLDSSVKPPHFSRGSNVLWSTVIIRTDGRVRFRRPEETHPIGEPAFLIRREPPWRLERLQQVGKADPLTADVTPLLLPQITGPQEARTVFTAMYDGRFTVAFDLTKIPKVVESAFQVEAMNSRILVASADPKFFIPQVVLRRDGQGDVVLCQMQWFRESTQDKWEPFENFDQGDGWIQIRPIRTWDAI